MNRCVGCDNVERSLDADLLCSWCVERRECFRKGEQSGRASAFRECAEEARRKATTAVARYACGCAIDDMKRDRHLGRVESGDVMLPTFMRERRPLVDPVVTESDLDRFCEHVTSLLGRLVAALLGVRPIPEPREVAPPGRGDAEIREMATAKRARAELGVTEAEVSEACRFFGEACADSMGYRTPIRKALENFVRGRAKR